jgi:tetratricopeptide (TPR) repeat protein
MSLSGGRYRPLSIATFAIEYELFGLKPHISHFINVLLFAFTGILIYIILAKISFPEEKTLQKKWYFSIAFLTTLFYLFHPIHTEAVANIKGRDEIMVFIGALLALLFSLKYLESSKKKFLLFSFIAFFLALLSKENAITFLAVIPLFIYFFTSHNLKKSAICLTPLLLSTTIFLVLRYLIVGGFATEAADNIMHNPFLEATSSEKYATIFYTLGLYIKLMFFPHPLTSDYYPYNIPLMNWSDWQVIVSILILLALGVLFLKGFRKKRVVAFGIAFYFITLSPASNLLFTVGTFMNERFVYISSLGFAFIIVYFLVRKLINYRRVLISVFAAILILFSIKTISRNAVWKNNLTLFTADAETSHKSPFSSTQLGDALLAKARETQNSGERKKLTIKAIEHLKNATDINPEHALSHLTVAHYENGDYDKTIELYRNLIKIEAKHFDAHFNLGTIYGKHKNKADSAVFYLEKAREINPQNIHVYFYLGVFYSMTREFEKSAQMFETTAKYDPNYPDVQKNLNIIKKKLEKLSK